jgi:peptide/nickel transport system substrate-binding protein
MRTARPTRRRPLALAAAVMVASGMAAFPAVLTGTAGSAAAQEEVTLRVALTQEIDSLNPFQAVFLSSTQVNRLMYEYLTTNAAEDSAPAPAFAESWEASEDNLTWTFKINQDLKWSDGKPVTAKDAAFTYNLILNNEEAANANGSAVSNYESVEAVDDQTLVIKTKQAQASMLTSEIPIVPEHVWADKVDQIADFTNTEELPAVGNGPYILTGYQEGQSVTLEANDNYWRGRPKVDVIQFIKYENSDAAVQGLKKGEIDLMFNLTPAQFKSLESEPNITTNAGRNRRYTEITANWSNPKPDGTTFGNGNPALKDVKFRQALAHAIDVNTLVDRVKQGFADPAYQVIPPVFPDWTYQPDQADIRAFDLAKANQLLDEAGYAKGPDGVRLGKDGQPINLRLLGRSDLTEQQQYAEFLKEWFAEVGVGLTPEFKSSNQSSDDQNSGNFDLAFTGWSVSPDPDYTLSQQTCAAVGAEWGDSNYCNPEYDRLYLQQQAELDKDKRKQIVQDMQAMLYRDVSAFVLVYEQLLEAYRSDKFAGFTTQPADGGIINNQSGYWGYYLAQPVGESEDEAAESDGGGSTAAIVGIVGGAAVLLAAAAWGISRRRSGTAADRE